MGMRWSSSSAAAGITQKRKNRREERPFDDLYEHDRVLPVRELYGAQNVPVGGEGSW